LRKRQPILSARSSAGPIHRREPADERPLIKTVLPVPVTTGMYLPPPRAARNTGEKKVERRNGTQDPWRCQEMLKGASSTAGKGISETGRASATDRGREPAQAGRSYQAEVRQT